ncbi:hypothetical protein [Niveispirillum lacus]|nr:hypothetical protein [Niveispirillum lacus]
MPKATMVGLTFSVSMLFSILLPDPHQIYVMAGLFLVFIVTFTYFMRHP